MAKKNKFPIVWSIGKILRIIDCKQPILNGIQGLIVFETRHMIFIRRDDTLKMIMVAKNIIRKALYDNRMYIDGSIFKHSIEDRYSKTEGLYNEYYRNKINVKRSLRNDDKKIHT